MLRLLRSTAKGRSRARPRIRFGLVLGLVLFVVTVTTAQGPGGGGGGGQVTMPVILSVVPNLVSGVLTITGTGFGTSAPTVTLEGSALSVVSFSNTQVVAAIPSLLPKTYLLSLTKGGTTLNVKFEMGIEGGDISAVVPGTGLSGGGQTGDVTLSVDTNAIQKRVTGVCAAGSAIRSIDNGGNVVCEIDDTGTGGVAAVTASAPLVSSGGSTPNISLPHVTVSANNTVIGTNAFASNTSGINNTATGANALQANTIGTSNTATGFAALGSNTQGHGNTATGESALLKNANGLNNTATGESALEQNTGGHYNTATGAFSLRNNIDGYDNTATGQSALEENTTGNRNTASGFQALHFNLDGSDNVASGFNSLLRNSSGSFNAAAGVDALRDNTSGNSNTGVGHLAGANATGSNNIYLGADVQGVAGESNTIYLGNQGTQTKTVIAGIRGTTVTGGEPVVVDANGRLGTGAVTPAANSVGSAQVIDDSLTASDLGPNSVTTSELASDSVTADKVAFNYAASTIEGGAALDVACVACVSASEVSFNFASVGANTFTGTQTINAGNLDLDPSMTNTGNITKNGELFLHNFGSANTFLGIFSGNFSLTGNSNTAMGSGALRQLATGSQNTAIGSDALTTNTNGEQNTAVGERTLNQNRTGNANTAVGRAALYTHVTGHQNTAVGYGALQQEDGGLNNVAIGFSAGSLLTTGSNNIYLGADLLGEAVESNTIHLGKVGTQTKTFIAGVRGITTVNPDAIPVVIDSAGQLGTVSSSRRFKEDIRDMGSASERLFQLRPVTFRYTRAYGDGSKPMQYGLVAEEVAQVFPELAVKNSAGDVETVHYETLNVLLLNELQRQEQTIRGQEHRIEALERQVQLLLHHAAH